MMRPATRRLVLALGAALGTLPAGCGGPPQAGQPLPDPVILGETGASPGQFLKPRAMDAAGGSLWIIDKTARIQRLDPDSGDPLSVWSMPESAAGKPVGVTVLDHALGPGGEVIATRERPLVFVADTHYHRVLVYRAPAPGADQPEEVARFGAYGREGGQFIYPTDVAVLQAPDGRVSRIYVAEYGGNDRIQIFDDRYQFMGAFGAFGAGEHPGEVVFNRPQSIDIDPASGELVVADAGNHRVGRFSLEGDLKGWTDGGAGGAEALRYPYGLLCVGDGTALIAEYGRNQLRRIDLADGRTTGVWGRPGREPGELKTPWAVAMIGPSVYVLDTGQDRAQRFRAGFRARRNTR
ncbi:MAG: hypothetical protein ACF8R7_16815 [Phycisphaerales bacterium JB039]